MWVGVYGATGVALIQTGVSVAPQAAGGDSPWWTTCPYGRQPGRGCVPQWIGAPVRPGDRVRTAVISTGTCEWRLSLVDARQRWWWATRVRYCGPVSRTVEWVAEGWQPQIPWPDFRTARFTNIWLERPDRRWVPARLVPADALWSNWVQTVAQERAGTATVCAAGAPSGRTVMIVWHNACGGA